MNYRHHNLAFVLLCLVTFVAIGLSLGCANMDNRDQRMVSGAAIGGTLACWPGALVGTGIGYLVGREDD